MALIPVLPLPSPPPSASEVPLSPPVCLHLSDNRLGVAELTLPPKKPGPPPHWHEMHDETFYITQGKVRFHVPDTSDPSVEGKDRKVVDAGVGEYMVVPIRAP